MRYYVRTALLCILLLFGAGSAALAQEEHTSKDHAAMLFSNRIQFNDQGEPIISVGIMDRQKEIVFHAEKGLIVNPSGPEGARLLFKGKKDWRAVLLRSTPGVLRWRIVLGVGPSKNFEAVKELYRKWKDSGLATSMDETGVLFGLYGKVLDTRESQVILNERFADEAAARKKAADLKTDFGEEPLVEQELAELPRGVIRLSSLDGEVEIEAKNALWFESADGSPINVKAVESGRGFRWHRRDDRDFAGSFYITVDSAGELGLGNILPSEKLLKGLVPAEMFKTAPLEALKAQAVTARGELLSKIGRRHLNDPWLICAEQHCQVYKGIEAEAERSSKAVEETRGQVLFSGDFLADARYSSNCGGHSENSEVAWPEINAPELRGRWDNDQTESAPITDATVAAFIDNPPAGLWCGTGKASATFRWKESLSQEKTDGLVKARFEIGSVKELKVLSRGVSGRMNRLELKGDKASAVIDGELEIRRLFGGLKSSLFVIDPPGPGHADWVFRGAGFGHGVGMCQYGAMRMAAAGRTFLQILSHYYQSISVEKLY